MLMQEQDLVYDDRAIAAGLMPVPTQLLVPGRGLEVGTDNPFEGHVIEDSPDSKASYERAAATGYYTKLHKEIGRVAFLGAASFMVPEKDRPILTEADAMYAVADAINPEIRTMFKRDRTSRTSYGNLVETVRNNLIDPNQVTGVVIHRDHAERFLKAARLVMPHTVFVVIPADKPGSTEMQKPSRNDRISDFLYTIAMRGVTPGDIETIARRDEMVQRNVLRIVNPLRKVVGLARGERKQTQTQSALAA